jgi:hypothetical protein
VRRGRLRPGAHPPGPLATPSRRWRAAQNGEVESPPGGSGGAKLHAPPRPSSRRAAEIVNVSGSGVRREIFELMVSALWRKVSERQAESYCVAVTCCDGFSALLGANPAAMR